MQENKPILPPGGFVRLPQILELFPISRSAWWAGVKSGRYPASVKLGAGTTAWRTEDIQQLLNQISKGAANDEE